jgi:N6-L-threonylcarbamoyladenine synthase
MSLLLAIETSCDETAAAIVEDGHRIRSNIVASQIEIHRPYGGVFPEVASRQHVLDILPVVSRAMREAEAGWRDLAAVAVTRGPGLAGSLLVGVNVAKALAWAQELPLVAVNHLEGHLYSNWLDAGQGIDPSAITQPSLPVLAAEQRAFPLLVLVVSGGHTELILMEGHGRYARLGSTLDDAAGEAFDKVARLIGLAYPGGPSVQKAGAVGNTRAFSFPRALTSGVEHRFDFSFSGLKTAVLRQVRELDSAHLPVADLAASFQAAVVDVLVSKTAAAAREYGVGRVCVCGGVAANRVLRAAMAERMPVPVSIPPISLCTDNAAMIGAAGYHVWLERGASALDFDVEPDLALLEG